MKIVQWLKFIRLRRWGIYSIGLYHFKHIRSWWSYRILCRVTLCLKAKMSGSIVGVRSIQLKASIHTSIHTYRFLGYISGSGIHVVS
jgi:hypothetical protein